MLSPFSLAAVSVAGAVAIAPSVYASSSLGQGLHTENQPSAQAISLRESSPEVDTESRFICKGCNEQENRTLARRKNLPSAVRESETPQAGGRGLV